MKTVVSIIILFFSVSVASAQLTNIGTLEVGGEMAFSSTSLSSGYGSGASENIFAFNPYIGVMVGGGAEMGIKLALVTGSNNYSSFGGYFAPAYNFTTKTMVVPYIEGLVGYASQKASSLESASGLGVGGGVGIKIIPGAKSIILISVQYLHQEYKYSFEDFSNYYYGYTQYFEESVKVNTINFGVGFRMFFGSSPDGTK